MNWKLIFSLSLFGLAMALGTVYFIPFNIEPFCWGAIVVICAFIIAKKCSSKYFLHGLWVGLVNSVWVAAAHVLLFSTYVANHAKEMEMMAKMPMATHPRILMLIVGPIVGFISGSVLGLLAFILSKMMKKQAVQ